MPVLLSNTLPRAEMLVRAIAWLDNSPMRALAMLLVFAALLFGVSMYYVKKMPTTDPGTSPTQAISLTGVRSDLLQIAQAERANVATTGHCSSLDELTSAGSLAMAKPERDGYTYEVSCSGSEFSVTAQHAAAPPGSPIRYPALSIDANMEIKSN